MADRSLVVITHSFPFGERTDFLEDEIEHLAARFDRVVLAPVFPVGRPVRLPAGVDIDDGLVGTSDRLTRLRALASSSAALLPRELQRAGAYLHPSVAPRVALAVGQYELVRRWAAGRTAPTVAYTYWLTPATAALGSVWSMTPVVSRAHGGDVFWERHRPPAMPFQRRSIDAAIAVAAVSSSGAHYLMRRHPESASRISVRRLGTHNPFGVAPSSRDSKIRLASVSSLTEVKRPLLLAEAVCLFARGRDGVVWQHFGSGPLADELRAVLKRQAPSTLDVHLHDHVENSQLVRILSTCPWDAFINVSASEGAPMSLMEAQSAGIPVVATCVGGTPEVVSARLNQIVNANADATEIAAAISIAICLPQELRLKRRQYWSARYRAELNYPIFAEWLSSL